MNKRKKSIIIVGIILTIIIAIMGGVAAYLTDTDTVTNTFTVGKVKISLTEPNWVPSNGEDVSPGDVINKDPMIENIGKNPAYIYMKVEEPIVNLDNSKTGSLFSYSINYPWVKLSTSITEDALTSVYYYNSTLNQNASTSKLFNSVKINNYDSDSINGNIDMVITGYAIQSNNLPNGTTIPSAYNSYFEESAFATDSWATIVTNVNSGNTSN